MIIDTLALGGSLGKKESLTHFWGSSEGGQMCLEFPGWVDHIQRLMQLAQEEWWSLQSLRQSSSHVASPGGMRVSHL